MMAYYGDPFDINCFSPDGEDEYLADILWDEFFLRNGIMAEPPSRAGASMAMTVPREKPAPKEPIRTLYVGRIPYFASRNEVERVFAKFGKIFNVFVMSGDGSKRYTFGFVTYYDPNHASLCLRNKFSLSVRGQKLFINAADAWHQPIVTENGSLEMKPKVSRAAVEMNALVNALLNANNSHSEDECSEDILDINFEEPEPSTSAVDLSLINKLNDDCLLKIFEFIPFCSKHNLSEVCKRWDALMSFYWNKVKVIDFHTGDFADIPCTPSNIKRYLKLCPNTSSISIGCSAGNELATDCINAIAYNCPQIKEVTIISTMLTDRQLAALAHYCRALNSFTMINCMYSKDGGISSVVKKCFMLRSIKIIGQAKSSSGYWLQHVNPFMKKLVLNVDCINRMFLVLALTIVHNSLEELSLYFQFGKHLHARYDLNGCEPMVQLKKLALYGSFDFSTRMLLCGLTHLELEANHVIHDDDIIYAVTHCPDLEKLNLTGSGDLFITQRGLLEIAKLTNLKVLHLGKIGAMTDTIVKTYAETLKNLEEISLYGCAKITDSSCKRLVTDLPNLTKLDLAYCMNLTLDIAVTAVAAADANPDKPQLTIYAMGSSMDYYRTFNSTSKVVLCMVESLCKRKHADLRDQFSLYDDDDDYDYDDDELYFDSSYEYESD